MTDELQLGGHVSIRDGYLGAAKSALRMGAGAFQFFPKNPRSLKLKSIDLRDAASCQSFCSTQGLVSVAHTPYPSNLAVSLETEPILYRQIVDSLRNDLDIAEACGSIGIVVHFGTFKQGSPLQGYQNIIQCINDVLSEWKGSAKLLIENQAGDHGSMGMTLEELVQIRKLCQNPEHIGFCLDTCHAFAAGMWQGAADEHFADKAEQLGYWDGLCVIHLNDSKYPVSSSKDRHARVGQGDIGEDGFRRLLQIDVIRNLPLIMESETGKDGTYREDLERVRRWVEAWC